MLFASVCSVLVIAYISTTPARAAYIYHGRITIAFTALTTLIWFIGSVVLVYAFINTPCRRARICIAMHASLGFGLITWAAFSGLLVVLCCLEDGIKVKRTIFIST